MAVESEIFGIIELLQAAFPAYKPANYAVTTELYARKMSRFDVRALKMAADRLIDKGRYFPSVSDLVKEAEVAQGDLKSTNTAAQHTEVFRYERQKLEDQAYLEGHFVAEEWMRLAKDFEKAGWDFSAEALREKARRIQAEMYDEQPVQ